MMAPMDLEDSVQRNAECSGLVEKVMRQLLKMELIAQTLKTIMSN